jgi:pyocin large subunit-like protein
MRGLVRFLICMSLVVHGAWVHAVELIGTPRITTTADGATVEWKTDVECGTKFQFGLNPAQLSQKAEGEVGRDHRIALQGLAQSTTYYYSLGSARSKLASGTFTTQAAARAATPGTSFVRRVLDALTQGHQSAETAAAPPARQTWGHLDSLRDHFERHGGDFGSASPEEYAAQAWRFLQRARAENLPMKLDPTDGTLRVFDPQTRAFAAYNAAGRTKTFFKPQSPTYWQRQPGRPVKSAELRLH